MIGYIVKYATQGVKVIPKRGTLELQSEIIVTAQQSMFLPKPYLPLPGDSDLANDKSLGILD